MHTLPRLSGRIIFSLFLFLPQLTFAQPVSIPLPPLSLDNMDAFRPAASNWSIASDVSVDRSIRHDMKPKSGTRVLVNLPDDDHRDNLFTTWEHGDIELEMEFMMPVGSNSGVYLQGRYEIQLFDSWGQTHPTFTDCGAIYQRWDDNRPEGRQGYEGHPPRLNVSRAPGLWQRLHIIFEAPRFDARGRKIANARFVKVEHNGVVVHENVEVTGPTRAAAFNDEQPTGPLMIQGDHGPVAFRNIRYKRFGPKRVQLQDVAYAYYAGAFDGLPDLSGLTPRQTGETEGFQWDFGATDPNQFAVEMKGTMQIPYSGSYLFQLQLDWVDGDPHFRTTPIGGAGLKIGDRTVLVHPGQFNLETGTIELSAGDHPFVLTYYKNRNGPRPIVALYAEGPQLPMHALNAPGTLPKPNLVGAILVDTEQEPVVLRGFVQHREEKRTHAVSVGEPSGIHYAMDLSNGGLLHIWKGDFIDATPMWHSRGQDQLANPRGSVIYLSGDPAVTTLANEQASWPTSVGADFAFNGYQLDEAGRPTFGYHIGNLAVLDHIEPIDEDRGLVRRLTFQTSDDGGSWWHRIATGSRIEQISDRIYAIDDKTYFVEIHDDGGAEPVIRSSGNGQELLLPTASGADKSTIAYSIIW